MVLTPDRTRRPSLGLSRSSRSIAFHDEIVASSEAPEHAGDDCAGPFSSSSRNISFARIVDPHPPERWTAALDERLRLVKAKMWEAQKSWSAEQEIYVKEVRRTGSPRISLTPCTSTMTWSRESWNLKSFPNAVFVTRRRKAHDSRLPRPRPAKPTVMMMRARSRFVLVSLCGSFS